MQFDCESIVHLLQLGIHTKLLLVLKVVLYILQTNICLKVKRSDCNIFYI